MVLGDIAGAVIKATAKNGKKALKKGVKNGVNGIVNYVKEKFKPKKERYLATPVTGKLLAIEGHLKKVPRHRTNPHPKYAKGVIGQRTLPITDRIIEAAEVSERVKGPYRQRLREYFLNMMKTC